MKDAGTFETPDTPAVAVGVGPMARYGKRMLFIFLLILAVAALYWYYPRSGWQAGPAKTEPWAYADKPLSAAPQTPSKQELIALMHNARTAMANGQKFDTYISSELLWIASNHVVGTGQTKDKLPVNNIEPSDQREYFRWMLSVLPPEDAMEFGDPLVAVRPSDLKNPEFYYIDPKTKEMKKFIVTQWRYWARLPATAKIEGTPVQGEIRFVFDNKQWKYHFENWPN